MGAQTSVLSRRQLLRVGAAPRLYAQYRGYFVKADFIAHGELILDVNTPAPHHLRVRKEGFISRTLGRIGVVADLDALVEIAELTKAPDDAPGAD